MTFGTQPSHTFIEGAHRFTAGRVRQLGDEAQAALDKWAPNGEALSRAVADVGWPPALALAMYDHVHDRLQTRPIEDFRIDFEDGYGFRPDAEEDADAGSAAREAASAARQGELPPFIGIRTKPFTPALRARSERTIALFLRTLIEAAGGLPAKVAVNLAKVTTPDQVEAMADGLGQLEHSLGLRENDLALEIMLETPLAFLDDEGRSPLPALRRAGGARLRGACFGPYDFTAASGIAPFEQRLGHSACDAARHAMLMAYSATPLWLADGSTSLLPVPVDGKDAHADAAHIRRAWRAHYDDVRRSLSQAFYQGWDVHAAQLGTRWAAVFAFYREGFAQAAPRLKALLDRAGESTRLGAVFDDPATGEALLKFVRRAVDARVISTAELAAASLPADDIAGRSFSELVTRNASAKEWPA